MVAAWWLQSHPNVRTIDSGAEWLAGFRTTLGREDLHSADWDHVDELTTWHNEKDREALHELEPGTGESSQMDSA
jgi:hypothetical protein